MSGRVPFRYRCGFCPRRRVTTLGIDVPISVCARHRDIIRAIVLAAGVEWRWET